MTWVDAFWAYVIGCMIATVIIAIISMLKEQYYANRNVR